MTLRTLLKTMVVVMAACFVTPVAADPLAPATHPDLTAAKVVLASLPRDLEVPALPNMSPRISSPDFVLGSKPEKAAPMQIAGRCGSSDYYCDSPGFLYCCGNSSDGYYCAADVNGCTK